MCIEIQDMKEIDMDRNIGSKRDRCGMKYKIGKIQMWNEIQYLKEIVVDRNIGFER